MADIRIKDLATTASSTAADDFLAVDGTTNGTRKLSAATPSFATSVTVPGVAGPTATDLTLAGGSTGASLVLGQGANANATITPTGTGGVTLQSSANNGDVLLKLRGTNASPNGTIRWTTSTDTYTVGIGSRFNVGDSGLEFLIGSSTTGMNLRSTGNLLIGTTTDSGNGKLQLATHTTSAGGIGFGPDTALFRSAAGILGVNHIGSNQPALRLFENGTAVGQLASAAGEVYLDGGGTGVLKLRTGASFALTTALTLASNQAATFAGAVTVNGTDKFILLNGATTQFSRALDVRTAGDTEGRLLLRGGGSLLFGDGTGTFDSTLARTSASMLTVTGGLTTTGAVAIGNTVAAAVAVASTHKVTMVIGGVTYYLLASNV